MQKNEVITYSWLVNFPDGSSTYFRDHTSMLEAVVTAARRCHPSDEIKITRLRSG